ncbi:hypothetical protein B0T26DRAFT_678220 [Lasiosphaeria miniovina]|uniref:Uncharacterized protein n=1 Tax=Lasiosphaeria miniovina TaxID=1954250 RepID=A0AA40DSK2_9PEZI|nr:uncharacterized protein B0T26DRAFT_678220 [Lasiosphaeria miniovina]KAK0713945.1 hypothetical protein B0T26DRAFT_678220 [Lasiosphaeria miniovina]
MLRTVIFLLAALVAGALCGPITFEAAVAQRDTAADINCVPYTVAPVETEYSNVISWIYLNGPTFLNPGTDNRVQGTVGCCMASLCNLKGSGIVVDRHTLAGDLWGSVYTSCIRKGVWGDWFTSDLKVYFYPAPPPP